MPSGLFARVDQRVDRMLAVVRAHRLRFAAAVILLALFLASVARNGLPLDRAHLLFWLTAGMIVATASRFGGWVRGLLRDWLPLLLVLLAYDWLRGYADRLGTHVHYAPQLPFDRWLSGGQTVSGRLQHLWWAGHPRTLDYVVMGIYLTHFVVTPSIAAWLWVRNRLLYREFAARLVGLFVAGLVTFALYPAAPPWMAGQLGRTGRVDNLVTVSLTSIAGVHTGTTVTYDVQGHGLYNPLPPCPACMRRCPCWCCSSSSAGHAGGSGCCWSRTPSRWGSRSSTPARTSSWTCCWVGCTPSSWWCSRRSQPRTRAATRAADADHDHCCFVHARPCCPISVRSRGSASRALTLAATSSTERPSTT